MKKKTAAIASLVTAAFIGSAMAATHTDAKGGMTTSTSYGPVDSKLPMIATGVQELTLSGRLNWEDDTEYNLAVSYGRFVTDNWLLGVEGSVGGVNSDKIYRAGVFAEYNFLTGTQWVPFIRGTVGYNRSEVGSTTDSADFLLRGGVKYFFRPNVAISGSLGGGWTSDGDDEFKKEVIVGLNWYF